MASNSRRKYGPSAGSNRRKRIEIAAKDTDKVRYGKRNTASTKSRSPLAKSPLQPPRSNQGKRLSMVKREERERRHQLVRLKTLVVGAVALIVIAATVSGIVRFASGPTFHVDSVEVSGVRHLTKEDVLGLAAVPDGTSLLRVDRRAVRTRVEADPWVASAVVKRRLPGTLLIEVKERDPAAVIDAGGTELWVVSADGYWLGERTSAETGTLSIRDLEEVDPQPGRRATSETLLNAVKIAAGLSEELRARTRVISAPTIERTALILDDDIEVFIGDADDLELKDRVAREIIEEQKGRLVYINVRVVSSPTWRGLDP